MKKILLLCVLFFMACDGVNTEGKGPPETLDPLENLYGNYLLECSDLGGGPRNQIFAKINTNGELETVVLTWSIDNCEGVYSLSDFDGNPLIGPEHDQDFEHFEVKDTPKNFFVIKITNMDNSDVTYVIFNKTGNKLHALTDIEEMPADWTKALEDDDIEEFANDPATAAPANYGILHFNKKDEIPDPLTALYKNWLSDCTDLDDGNADNQIFATFSADQPLVANLMWDNVGCAGDSTNYTLANPLNGMTISEPGHYQNIEFQPVLGIPLGMLVVKATATTGGSPVYALIHYNSVLDEFYELVPFNSSPATWDEWDDDPDVSDFAADPTTATPNPEVIFHFDNLDLP
ncbi:MAG: hypothetical protein IT286_05005 [Proteobacteria bacterium]|jgi:hypothetical protein|nr:hypothetical protein [Pseudomonadota bacterium]